MKNLWSDREAQAFLKKYAPYGQDLALRTYTARLIGRDPALVLHGGGNTSVKTQVETVTGERVSVLCVKGSGWDLDSIEPAGHPAVRLAPLRGLRSLTRLSDEDMVNLLRINMLDSQGPNPSVESLLHAFLPHKFIDHTHANAVLALVDQKDAEKRAREWSEGRLAIVPYIMPGFALSKKGTEIFEQNPQVEGLVLLRHGIFTFGDSARQSYDRMIAWVTKAERLLTRSKSVSFSPLPQTRQRPSLTIGHVANSLRSELTVPMILRYRTSPAIREFVDSREAETLSQIGPATPDHAIRTKPKPLWVPPVSPHPARRLAGSKGEGSLEEYFRKTVKGRVEKFKRSYESYFQRQCRIKKVQRKALDSIPRVILVPGVGLFGAGADAKAADIALDIYEATINIIANASRRGHYASLSESDLFDVEYWSLEQAKLGKVTEKTFARKIVWISGAASGIGRATARAFGELGAHVFLTDRDAATLRQTTEELRLKERGAWAACDVTHIQAVEDSFERCLRTFGGVDIVVSNAGTAPTGDIANCADDLLRKSFEVNFFSHQNVAKTAAAILKRQNFGGAILFNASKSAFNPGPGFGPYSLPKAGVIALMRQYAIELGSFGIRCNAINADRIRTGLFGKGLLEKRAKARGLTVEEYVSGNLLKKEVFAEDVAQAFISLAQARKTTGAVLPVDGGNAAAFPR